MTWYRVHNRLCQLGTASSFCPAVVQDNEGNNVLEQDSLREAMCSVMFLVSPGLLPCDGVFDAWVCGGRSLRRRAASATNGNSRLRRPQHCQQA